MTYEKGALVEITMEGEHVVCQRTSSLIFLHQKFFLLK